MSALYHTWGKEAAESSIYTLGELIKHILHLLALRHKLRLGHRPIFDNLEFVFLHSLIRLRLMVRIKEAAAMHHRS